MRLEIYNSAKLITPFKEEEETSYNLGWSGSLEQLRINPTDDDKILEKVFDAFNHDKCPVDFGAEWRSLSVGDVFCIEDRDYKCLAMGWQKLDNFTTENSHVK